MHTCDKPGAGDWYAPCLAERLNAQHGKQAIAYAEQLIYPDFAVREPIFLDEKLHPKGGARDRDRWRTLARTINERAICKDGWMEY